MPKMIITNLSVSELLAAAVENARTASAAIDELLYSPIPADETRLDRALQVAQHARVLSEAWAIVDSLMTDDADDDDAQISCDCPNCAPRKSEQAVPSNLN